MKKLINTTLLLFGFLYAVGQAIAEVPKLPEGAKIAEVHVASMDFQGSSLAQMVARPCDKHVQCENMLIRIDGKTVWRDDGVLISYKQARKLNWQGAVVVVDINNNALMVSRIFVGTE
ncbi:MAG: hypothetical protein ACPGSC_09560 [Granulosicoccaceae bacterium]